MAIDYASASSEYHQKGTAAATESDLPITVMCWFRLTDINDKAEVLVCLTNSTDTSSGNYTLYTGATTNILFLSGGGGNRQSVLAGNQADVWHHGAGVAESSTLSVWRDGVEGTPNTASTGPSGVNSTAIGIFYDASPTLPFDGSVAHALVWKGTAVSDSDIGGLSGGRHPYTVRPLASNYWRLTGNGPVGTRVRDSIGGLHLNDNVGGTPVKAEEQPVVRNCFLQGVG